jgi:hypothetical protein
MVVVSVACTVDAPPVTPDVKFEARSITTGTWTYDITRITDRTFHSHQGQRLLSIAYDSASAVTIIVAQDQMRFAASVTDSLFVNENDLSVMSRSRTKGTRRQRSDFQNETLDSSYADVEMDDGYGDSLLVVGDLHLAYILQYADLRPRWRRVFRARHRTFDNYRVEVDGTMTITVPAGSFDCWKLSMTKTTRWGPFVHTWWISKEHGWLIKTDTYDGWGIKQLDDFVEMALVKAPPLEQL